MSNKIRIMVMGAGGVAGMNFIECLRMKEEGYYIVGCDINKWHLEIPPIDASYVVPYSLDEGYIDAVRDIITKEEIQFIHAQPDMEVEVLSENRERLQTGYFLPSKDALRICRDKMATNRMLREKGVPVPLSLQVEKITGLKDLIAATREVSCQERVWIRAIKGAGSKAALPVKSFRQAKEWIHYWRSTKRLESRDFMVCEYLPGREYAFQSLWHKGRIVVSQARERLEYLMGNLFPSGQSSSPSVAVTVHNDHVNEVATRAVLAIDKEASGIFCIDLKENSAGVPCVTEINCGRFFTTANFFARLGCNMPHMYVSIGMGRPVSEMQQYNALPEGQYWLRAVDKLPVLMDGKWRSHDHCQ
ncbi:MAG: ATP-grasp domain-containing protein [Nitrospirales bacterium]|nr:ATP-grasp domain-containing protein [Nitrospirales bacterium]